MNLKKVVTRVRRGDAYYALGRFKTVRATYSGLRHWRAGFASAPTSDIDENTTLFPATDINHVVQTIRDEAVFVGLKLPGGIVAEIDAFARSEPLHAIYDPEGPTFLYSDVVRGRCADGRPIPAGGIREPSRCPAVKAVVNDPVLRAIVRGYLGHEPRRVMTLLGWSFASDIADQERRRLKHVIIDYHYDDGGFNFVYANFYITDTDRTSGAHVMMKRSHKEEAASNASRLDGCKRNRCQAAIWN